MARGRGRDYDPAFKLKVVARLDGGTNVSELSRELGIGVAGVKRGKGLRVQHLRRWRVARP